MAFEESKNLCFEFTRTYYENQFDENQYIQKVQISWHYQNLKYTLKVYKQYNDDQQNATK